MTELQKKLFELQDKDYKEFQSKLIPTVEASKVIGVRTPELRKFAKEFNKSGERDSFMEKLPHYYYEENNLHGFLIESIKDFDEAVDALDKFLPYVDNWATCDMMSPKILAKRPDELILKVREWIASEKTYTVRYAVGTLMRYFLDERFDIEYLELAASVKSEEYYVNMMVAWYFATALAKQYEAVIPFIENNKLDKWIHNKTIQKAVESNRITAEQKNYLRTLRIK